MDITYLGAGSVSLVSRNLTLVTDPPPASSGLKFKGNPDVILLTDRDYQAGAGEAMLIDGPGEYEVKGSLITGIAAQRHGDSEGLAGTIYSIVGDGINVVVVGNIAPSLSSTQIETLGQVDVLVVPVGGQELTLDAAAAAQLVSQLEPKYVIPTHFEDGKSKYPKSQDKLEKFLAEMGSKPEPMAKLKLASKDLPEKITTVTLTPALA